MKGLFQKTGQKGKKRMVVLRLMSISVVPILMLGILLTLVGTRSIRDTLKTEMTDELRSAAISVLGAYDAAGSGDFVRLESGTLIKGKFVVSNNYALLDKMQSESNLYVTLYYGENVIVSSLRDVYGARVRELPLPEAVKQKVLKGAEEYFSESIRINGKNFYGLFEPIVNEDGTVAGTIFICKHSEEIENVISDAVFQMSTISIAVVIITSVACVLMGISIVRFVYGLLKEEEQISELQHANEAKSSFLAQMSHEIRTPINAVLGMDEMILRECKDENISTYAANIRSSGQSLLALINDILDFSKIESGKLEILPVQYDLASLLNDTFNMINMRAAEKNLEVRVLNDAGMPSKLMGDEVRIRQIITNLLTNAVKYTKKGSVTLSVGYTMIDEDSLMMKVSVADTGMGIKPEDREKLFSSFQRLDETSNRHIEGTGLGLAITKQLVDLMSGTIKVESEYGKGSTFTFEVPQSICSFTPIGNFADEYMKNPAQQYSYKEEFTAPDAKILVVDDVQVNLTVMKGLLKYTKIKVDLVQSGMECLEAVVDTKYDMIFLDHMMPEMDGIETFERMQAMPDCINKDTPTVALTANAILGAKEEYLSKGFTDYLSKPIQSIDLEKMLIKYLPPELVTLTKKDVSEASSEGASDAAASSEGAGEGQQDGDKPVSLYKKLAEFVDVETGKVYCPDESFYREIVETYVREDKSGELEKAFNEKDWHNYRIIVHAIKSNSLCIGAVGLSEDAKALEAAAKADNVEFIESNHQLLIDAYREMIKNLATVL